VSYAATNTALAVSIEGNATMRRIISGTAYDTETGDLIVETSRDDSICRLYRTRYGVYFLYAAGPEPVWNEAVRRYTDDYTSVEHITPISDEKAANWLEQNANELVEKYFGEMPEAGAPERRFTLRLPNNLAERLEAIARSQNLTLSRYIIRSLERCASVEA
jgi:hypothetical protein